MKKSWLPVFLCLAFILGWEIFVVRPTMKKEQEKKQQQAALIQKSAPPAPADNKKTSSPISVSSASVVDEGNDFERIELSQDRSLQVYSKGSLGSVTFSDYQVRRKKTAEPIVMLKDKLQWKSSDPLVQDCLSKLKKIGSLEFAYEEAGKKCHLEYRPDAEHVGLLKIRLSLKGFPESSGVVEFRGTDSTGSGPVEEHHYLSFKIDDSKKDIREKDLVERDAADGLRKGSVDWLAWGDKYFLTLLIPSKEAGSFNPNIVYGPSAKDPSQVSFGFQYPLLNPQAQELSFQVYFGTRDSDNLKLIQPTLVEAVDLGFFAAVARAMLWALKALYKIVQNYGLAIILLTIIVRILFWPLNRKVFESGQKMKLLQPEIERLKAKYGKDKAQAEQMNRELLALYKTQKVNPLGSCLPLLAQMPIFLGLYGALNHSLDLYQAPFVGWVQDLSSPDPFYVFPVLWTLTLLAYTKITPMAPPTTGDGKNAPDMTKIMFVMNIVFGFLSKDWPAGLTLYLFVSNLVGITQQLMFKRAAKLQPIQEGV